MLVRGLAIVLVSALPALAGPAEPPPAGFAGAQYVDSAGCVFRRDGAGGWQARLTRDGQPLCGYAPTGGSAPRMPGPFAAGGPPETMITDMRTLPGALTSCPNQPALAQRYALSDGRVVMRCSPEVDDPVGFINRAGVAGLRVSGVAPGAGPLRGEAVGGTLLEIALRYPVAASAPQKPRRAAPKAAASAEKFVQIGAFGDPANAQKVKERIRALNLPVATSRLKRGGKELELIFSGPFDAKGANCALELLRGKGFPEAKLR